MHLVEELYELAVGYLGRVVGYLESFCIYFPLALVSFEAHRILGKLTTSSPRTHSAIIRILRITPNITHSRIVQSLPLELFPEHMLNAPKAASCDRRFGGAFGSSQRGGPGGVETEGGRCAEGAEEARDEGGHCGGHEED